MALMRSSLEPLSCSHQSHKSHRNRRRPRAGCSGKASRLVARDAIARRSSCDRGSEHPSGPAVERWTLRTVLLFGPATRRTWS